MSYSTISSLGPYLTNTFGDRYLFPINREAFNRVGSETIFSQRFRRVLEHENTLHIFVGLDSGLLGNFFNNKKLPKGSCLAFVEIPEILDRIRAEGLLDNLAEQILISNCQDFLTRLDEGDFRKYFYLDKVQLWQSIAAENAHLPEYLELESLVRDKINQLLYEVRTGINTQMYIQRQLTNLSENRVHAQQLSDVFRGKTAVLLAGGPSLDEFLPWVKENRENLVVLAVSRIARRLQEVDLVPDVICSIDPQPISFDVSKEMLLFQDRTLFLNLYHVFTPLLSNWRGHSVYLGERFPWVTDLNVLSGHTQGPTVTNVVLSAAIAMGFSTIVLGGVDLCYSRDGYSHARGSYEAQVGPKFYIANEAQIETNSGRMATTTRAMVQAAQVLDEQAKEANKRGCRIVTTFLEGAKMSHVEYLPREQIKPSPLDRPAWQEIQGHLPGDTTESRIAYYQENLNELYRGKQRLEEIAELCDLALRYNDGLFGRNGIKKSFKYKKKLDGIEQILNASYQDFSPLIKHFGIKEFLQLSSLESSKSWSDEEVERKGRQYYQTFKTSALQLLDLVTKAMELQEHRLEEEREIPDIDRLMLQWRNNREPGRALLWQTRRPAACCNLGREKQDQLRELEKAFQRLVQDEQKEAENIARFKNAAHPELARKKAPLLFRQKDAENLQVLHQGLVNHADPAALPIRHLIAGYLAELAGAPEQALAEYHAVINEPLCSGTEEALRRIVSISLNLSNTDDALLGLECLTNLSPVYLPQYADLVKLLGDTNRALDLYADYLEKVPGDPQVLMRVGNLYRELGMEDEALTIFRYLGEQEPENSLFRSLIEEMVRTGSGN